ncbi:MAG: 6-carboxytetrahydropterin synthase [Pyrobaculum sp.]|jgi:6-pyruvoyl-tetrahydropterin synthase
MRTCVELRGSISVAHNPAFSPQWARVHGHDYMITVGICREGAVDLVVDASIASKRLMEILKEMDGRYLASPSEDVRLPRENIYIVPCSLPGVSGECIAKHIADLLDATWVRVCESAYASPCFYVEKKT